MNSIIHFTVDRAAVDGMTALSTVQDFVFIYAPSALLGGLLGLLFFGGLWWTTRRLPHSRRPALLTLGSFLVRTPIVLLGFYLLIDAGLGQLAAGMIGFLIVRTVLTYSLGPSAAGPNALSRGAQK